jgi:hypothetical protein
MAKASNRLVVARAEALFVSDISAWSNPTKAAVTAAIRDAIRSQAGVRGCAGQVGAAYGEHPEIAAARMRWARRLIEAIYLPASGPSPTPPAGKAQSRASTNLADTPATAPEVKGR